jgi:hypothetical protein
MKNFKIVILVLLMSLIFMFPLSRGNATLIWSEDFSNPSDWVLEGYHISLINEERTWVWNSTMIPDDSNSRLESKNVTYVSLFGSGSPTLSLGRRNSTVAYGTWSFDWYVTPGEENLASDTILFIMNDFPANASGFIVGEGGDAYGYSLRITTIELYNQWNPRFLLVKESNTYAENIYHIDATMESHFFTEPIEGSHHVDITRSNTGEFSVFFNNEFLFSAVDNTYTTSDEFVYGSWGGDSAIDNITVSNSVDLTVPETSDTTTTTTTTTTATNGTPGFEFLVVLTAATSVLFYRKKR